MGIRACPKLKKPIGTPIGMLAVAIVSDRYDIYILLF